jgi:hypothetical protein
MFIKSGKTNWVLIIVVAVIAGAVSGGLVAYINDTVKQTASLPQIAELGKPAGSGGDAGIENGKTDIGAGFNLVFKYGVGGKNVLDTFENKFTKDMIIDSPVIVDFKLTPAEKESIGQKIKELDLFNKESKIKADSDIQVEMTPCSNYYLKVQDNNSVKEINWDNCTGEISQAYRQFADFMINLIESKKEYKNLPAAQGGYL